MKNLLILTTMLLVACNNNSTQSSETNKALNKAESRSEIQIPETILSDSSVIALPQGFEYSDSPNFSVLSWNVEHFVDQFDNPYTENRRENDPPENMLERKKMFIQAIKDANADIVILQEFESGAFLEKMAKNSLSEMGYQFFADAPSRNWYMNVVIMSRFPLGMLLSYGNLHTPILGERDKNGLNRTQSHINTRMWTIEVFPKEDYSLWITGVHLKAGRSKEDKAMRLGQIRVLKDQFTKLKSLNPSANLMMAGDFNAYPNSAELIALKDTKWGPSFIDPFDSLTYTHPADSPRRRLDYMIINPELEKELINLEVWKPYSADSMRMISDHLPVLGQFARSDK